MSGRDAFRDDGRFGVLANVNHLRARICLLIIVGDCHAVELGSTVIAFKYARGVFPRDGRARLHLCPGELGVNTCQQTAFGDKVQHATLALLVTRIPVLYGGVLYFGTILDDNLHNGSMQLVLVTHRSRAALEIADVGVVVGLMRK